MKKILVRKPEPRDCCDVPCAMPKNSLYPPHFCIDGEQMPEIKDFEVGEKYSMLVEVEMKSKSEDDKRTGAEFEITAYNYQPKKKMEDMTSEEFGKYTGEALSKNK